MYINEKTFTTHPETTATEKEMQSYLFLEENGVDYIRAEHDEAATIELCEGVEKIINAKICKNLLLCNRQQTKFYLLLIPGDMPFKTKYLSAQINSSRLSFGSGEKMEELLNVSPGSLTVLSLMFDKEENVELLIEKNVFKDEYFACHPCVNTATVKFSTADLKEKVLPALGRTYTVVDLECPRMKFNSVVFDLDGTLLDTLGDLRDSVNFALEKNNLPKRTTEEIRSFVGNGIRLLIERSVPENTPIEITDKCFLDFKEYYKYHSAILTKPYDGIIDLMKKLKSKGVKIAVVSNKADFAVKTLMEDYFSGLYDCAYGERAGVERKPAPDGVLGAISEIGGYLENTVYIGDSEVDVETAKNAKLPCIAVTWGFRDKKVLESLNPEYIVDSPIEILDIIER